MGRLENSLCRYRGHPEFDDLLQEARIAMWDAAMKAKERDIADIEAYALRAGWLGAQGFLRSCRSVCRARNSSSDINLAPLRLEDPRHDRCADYEPKRLRVPDFAPALVFRLYLSWRLSRLDPRLAAVLRLCCLRGLTRMEAAAQLGLSKDQMYALLKHVPRDAIPDAHNDIRRASPPCPRCGRARSLENTTPQGACRACRREAQRKHQAAYRERRRLSKQAALSASTAVETVGLPSLSVAGEFSVNSG